MLAFLVGISYTLDRVGDMMREASEVQAVDVAEDEADATPVVDATSEPEETGLSDEPWERIKHHEQCTHRAYREKYYFACFPDGTRVYDRPEMESGPGNTA